MGRPDIETIQSVLVACPTYNQKEYCFREWIDSVRQLRAEILAVDTSDTPEFYEKWKSQVPIDRIDVIGKPPNIKIALGMEHIRRYFLGTRHKWWLVIECDCIVPSYVLDFVLAHSQDMDWVAIPYPSRTEDKILINSFGCSLFSRRMMSQVTFEDAPADVTTDGWFFNKIQGNFKFRTLYSALRIEHRKESKVGQES